MAAHDYLRPSCPRIPLGTSLWPERPRCGPGVSVVGGASLPRTLASRRDHPRGAHPRRHAPDGAQAKKKSEPPTPDPQRRASQRTGRPLMTRHARFPLVSHRSHSSHTSHPPGQERRPYPAAPHPEPRPPNPKHRTKSGGALPRPGRVWPMRHSAGGGRWESVPGSPLIGRGWTGGPCAHCGGRLRGALCTAPPRAWADETAGGHHAPQDPPAAHRQRADVRLEPLWNEHYAGLPRTQGDCAARRHLLAGSPRAAKRRQNVAGGVSRRDARPTPRTAPKAAEEGKGRPHRHRGGLASSRREIPPSLPYVPSPWATTAAQALHPFTPRCEPRAPHADHSTPATGPRAPNEQRRRPSWPGPRVAYAALGGRRLLGTAAGGPADREGLDGRPVRALWRAAARRPVRRCADGSGGACGLTAGAPRMSHLPPAASGRTCGSIHYGMSTMPASGERRAIARHGATRGHERQEPRSGDRT